MAENDGKKKRKPNKGKVAFMFAFAVTVLSSRAASLAASATTVPNDDFDNQTTDSTQKDIGANPAYQKSVRTFLSRQIVRTQLIISLRSCMTSAITPFTAKRSTLSMWKET